MISGEGLFLTIIVLYIIVVFVVFGLGRDIHSDANDRIAILRHMTHPASSTRAYEDRTAGARMMLGSIVWPVLIVVSATKAILRLIRAVPVLWSDARGER